MEKIKLRFVSVFALTAVLIVVLAIQHLRVRRLEKRISNDAQISTPNSQKTGGNMLRLPAPHLKRATDSGEGLTADKAAELHSLFHVPKLSMVQVEGFLNENQRSASRLLAAFRTSGEKKFLIEAMEKFPNDPQVAFEAYFKGELPPEERRKWIEALKRASPENALANFLAAEAYFKSGQTDFAVGELEAAFGKDRFDNLTLERMQNNEEAYRASGFSEAESRNVAMFQTDLPLLKEMNALTENMVKLAASYRQDGDLTSAEATVAIAQKLGEHFRNSGNSLLVHQLLGIGMEQSALNTLDPETVFGPAGRTPQDLLNDLNAEQAALSKLVRETVPLQERMTPWTGSCTSTV